MFVRLRARKRWLDAQDTVMVCVILLEVSAIFVLLSYGAGMIDPSTMIRLLALAATGVSILFFVRSFACDSHHDFHHLAKCVDLRYDLKDRMLTASWILARSEATTMERLQLRDAAFHAGQVDPDEVFPFRLPRYFRLACGLLPALLLARLFVFSYDFQLALEPPVVSSRMEQVLTVEEAFSSGTIMVSLAEIGDALSTAEATRDPGHALQTGDLPLAASELESMQWNAMTPPERGIMVKMLQEAAEKIRQRNLSQLSKVAEQLATDLLLGNLEEIPVAAAELAEICLAVSLLQKTYHLSQEHNADRAAAIDGGQGTEPGKTPGTAWGSGDAGDPLTGAVTKIDTTRQPHQVPGRQGTGPSEMETILSNDGGEETVGRPYVDVSRQALRAAETEWEPEPVPLRLRQVIRKYFHQADK